MPPRFTLLTSLVVLTASCEETKPTTAPPSPAAATATTTAPADAAAEAPPPPRPVTLSITSEPIHQYAVNAIGVRSDDFGLQYLKSYPVEGGKVLLDVATGAGNTIQVAGETFTADAKGNASLKVDLASAVKNRVAEQPFEGAFYSLGWIKVPLTIAAPDGGKREGKLDFEGDRALLHWLQDLSKGPVLLDGETAGPSERKSAVLVLSQTLKVFGSPSRFADVDLVALQTWSFRKRTCGPYVDAQGGNEKHITLTITDVAVRMFDRRAGKELGVKQFPSKMTCPKTILASSTGERVWDDQAAVEKWAASFVKK